MWKDVMNINDEDIKRIVEYNQHLETEYSEYLHRKENMEEKQLNFQRRLFLFYRNFDPNLKMNKYSMCLTFCAIIFSFLLVSTIIIHETELFRYSIFIFFFSCVFYILASFSLSNKKIFHSANMEANADMFLLFGIISILMYLLFNENFQFYSYKVMIIILILCCIYPLWNTLRVPRIDMYIFFEDLSDKIKKKFR